MNCKYCGEEITNITGNEHICADCKKNKEGYGYPLDEIYGLTQRIQELEEEIAFEKGQVETKNKWLDECLEIGQQRISKIKEIEAENKQLKKTDKLNCQIIHDLRLRIKEGE